MKQIFRPFLLGTILILLTAILTPFIYHFYGKNAISLLGLMICGLIGFSGQVRGLMLENQREEKLFDRFFSNIIGQP